MGPSAEPPGKGADAKRTPATVSRTWAVLDGLNLVKWTRGRPVVLLCEDARGDVYRHPGQKDAQAAYFGLSRRYWLDGWDTKLGLPAKAMLLILLAASPPGT